MWNASAKLTATFKTAMLHTPATATTAAPNEGALRRARRARRRSSPRSASRAAPRSRRRRPTEGQEPARAAAPARCSRPRRRCWSARKPPAGPRRHTQRQAQPAVVGQRIADPVQHEPVVDPAREQARRPQQHPRQGGVDRRRPEQRERLQRGVRLVRRDHVAPKSMRHSSATPRHDGKDRQHVAEHRAAWVRISASTEVTKASMPWGVPAASSSRASVGRSSRAAWSPARMQEMDQQEARG